jgi:hypothetical protein
MMCALFIVMFVTHILSLFFSLIIDIAFPFLFDFFYRLEEIIILPGFVVGGYIDQVLLETGIYEKLRALHGLQNFEDSSFFVYLIIPIEILLQVAYTYLLACLVIFFKQQKKEKRRI